MIFPLYPDAAADALVAAGAVPTTNYSTTIISTASATAYTLADVEKVGQVKKVLMNIDGGGTATLTPATFADGTSIAFADVGDFVVLMWVGLDGWRVLEKGNEADGGTFPAIS